MTSGPPAMEGALAVGTFAHSSAPTMDSWSRGQKPASVPAVLMAKAISHQGEAQRREA